MNTVRVSWEETGGEIHVNWLPNEEFGKRNSTFKLIFEVNPDNNQRYFDRISGDGFEFILGV